MQGFTLAGHVAVDKIITKDGIFSQLGGPPCFAASLGKTLGFPVNTITKIGEDFPKEYEPVLTKLDIRTVKSTGYPSTRFVINYKYNPRRMKLPTKCEPIILSEIADADRLLLCPIAGEINDQLMIDVDTGFLGLDPQGLLRASKPDFTVIPRKWWNPEVLRRLDLLKSSSSEHHLITGDTDIKDSLRKLIEYGVKVAVITDGSNGAYVMHDSEMLHVPVFPVNMIDSTGAGDVFIAGLAAFIDEGLSWACAVASASSSAVVETRGIKINRNRQEILERTELVYEHIKRLR